MSNDKDSGVSQTGQMVTRGVYGSGMDPRAELVAGCLWCAAGGAVTGLLGVFGSFCVAYGACVLTATRGRRGLLLGLAVALAAGALGVLGNLGAGPSEVVVYVGVGMAMGSLFGFGRLTSGRACMVAIVAALAFFASDALGLALQGTSVSAYMNEVLSSLREGVSAVGGSSIDATAAYQTVVGLLSVLWPSAYTMLGFGACACAAVGGRVALRHLLHATPVVPFGRFDLPLWVVALLAVGVAGLALAGTLPVGGSVVSMVAANVLVGVRLLLAVQGLAVVVSWTRARHMGPAVASLVVVVALVLDVQFFVMAVVGLVDVWANFRHLVRGGASPAEAS